MFGFRYVWRKRPLLSLLVAFSALNLVLGFIGPVFIAYMLSFNSETTMGLIMSLGATGMLVGSIVASAVKVTDRRVLRIVIAMAMLGAMLILVGSTTMLVLILIALWIGMLVVPYASAMSQSIWMAKVEPDVQGRVFSVRSMIAQITNPVALAMTGLLVDRVFIPLMAGDSGLSSAFARLTGRGPSAGYAAFFVAVGIACIIVAIGAWSFAPLRNLERDLPDAEGLPTEGEGPGLHDLPLVTGDPVPEVR